MKDIKGYEGLYSADESGKIWSHRQNKFLKETIQNHGYHQVTLYKLDDGGRKFLVHRLIAQAFLKNPENLSTVNHKDFDKGNNIVRNLGWSSFADNKRHASKFGVNNKGEKHGLSKLTENQVREIKRLYPKGDTSYMKLGTKYKVSAMTISDIIRGITWGHIK